MKRHGVHLAVVTEVSGRDARVRLQLPWLPDGDATAWARVAMPMAGASRGCYALPEVGDQVLVVFEHGDADRPIVVGALWSTAQPPPETNAGGGNPAALVKSRAGHRIIFDDAAGRVTIVDATRENRIVLDGDGDAVRVESAGDLVVRAAGDVVVDARTIAVRATGDIAVAAPQVVARAGALAVTAGTQLTVTGAAVTARSGVE